MTQGRRRKPATLKPRLAHAALCEHRVLGPWVERIGAPRFPRVSLDPFAYLARAIVYQQLAGAAAATIHGRFEKVLKGRVTPARVLKAPEGELRGAGLSRGKLAAIRDLAEKAPRLGLDELEWMDDDEVIQRLTTVRGIGPWTAQMFLMFALRRPDVWPGGDLGVRQGYALIHGVDPAPTEKEMPELGEAYRPWRSAVAWYCWRALEVDL